MTHTLAHDTYQEHISQLIDGELSSQDQPSLFAHLSECAECRNFLNSALTLRSNLAAGATIPLPAGFELRVPSVDAEAYARPAAFRLALAASIAFVLLMGSLVFGPQVLRLQSTSAPSGIITDAPQFPLPQQN
ncbi:MAG TPA: zf-HC2 domain-containing protein [Bacteroidota bacterium]